MRLSKNHLPPDYRLSKKNPALSPDDAVDLAMTRDGGGLLIIPTLPLMATQEPEVSTLGFSSCTLLGVTFRVLRLRSFAAMINDLHGLDPCRDTTGHTHEPCFGGHQTHCHGARGHHSA
ncbi:MAG: hypothetical protein EBZ69_02455 [Alphaproteobacteria bacterium]|nr:hypothetical protein [Alphaproteobacteria bacterium]